MAAENKIETLFSCFLTKIQDAKKQENLTSENKIRAKMDLLIFLNEVFSFSIKNKNLSNKGFFNEINIHFNETIKKTNKKIKYKYIDIREDFLKFYLITLFICSNKEDLLYSMTNWKKSDLTDAVNHSKITTDEKELLLITKNNFEEKQKIEKDLQ